MSFVHADPALADKVEVKVGEPPPKLEWLSVAGDTLSWDDLRRDGTLLVVFWATWCTACKKDLPKIQDLYRSHSANGALAMATISLGEPADRVAKVVEKRKMEGIALVDPKEVNGKMLGIEYVPTVWLLDSEGRLVYAGPPKLKTIDRHLAEVTSTAPEEQP